MILFKKDNRFLAKHTTESKISQFCSNISMKTIFKNTDNDKTNETLKTVLKLLQRLELKSSNKNAALQILSI